MRAFIEPHLSRVVLACANRATAAAVCDGEGDSGGRKNTRAWEVGGARVEREKRTVTGESRRR